MKFKNTAGKIKAGKKTKLRIVGVIPARFASTRFPGKPLAVIAGKPMIQHVYESSVKSRLLDDVYAATDNKKIFNTVLNFGGKAVMTSGKHKSGTDRTGESLKLLKNKIGNADIIVNIQGDEPFIDYRNIDKAIEPLIKKSSLNVSTLCIKIKKKSEVTDPNIVKVVFDENNYALYFSRCPVPFNRDKQGKTAYYKHIGLYVYRKQYLLKFIKLPHGRLEHAEKLEQLRILENGEKIKVIETKIDSHSVDTKKDLKKIKNHFTNKN